MKRFLILSLVLACFCGLAAGARADDPGYFLSWQQKKQLTCLGRIQDGAGTWYDVWICPGYAPPGRYAKDHFFAAGRNFREYFEANKYHMLKKGSSACFDWALKECGLGFTVKGIPRAWGKHFTVAHERTQRRVFGWWLAYPWAFMEASVETAFRGALGAAGTAGGIGSGLAVVPAWHALDSAVAGTWNLGVNTIALPAVGIAWNTAVAPPLALVGQKPAESRVDGFWVTVVASGQPPQPLPGNMSACSRSGACCCGWKCNRKRPCGRMSNGTIPCRSRLIYRPLRRLATKPIGSWSRSKQMKTCDSVRYWLQMNGRHPSSTKNPNFNIRTPTGMICTSISATRTFPTMTSTGFWPFCRPIVRPAVRRRRWIPPGPKQIRSSTV